MTEELVDNFLEHYGVRGMRWGVKRQLKKLTNSKDRQRFLDEKDKKWIDKVNADPKVSRVAKRAARELKRKVLPKLRAEYKGVNLNRDPYAKSQYEAKMKSAMISILDRQSYKAHKMSPSRTREVVFEPQSDGTLKARVVPRENYKITKQQGQIARADEKRAKIASREAKKEASVKHADEPKEFDNDPYDGLVYLITRDAEGFFVDIEPPFEDDEVDAQEEEAEAAVEHSVDNFLEHYGVKGMRWGVRRSNPSGGSAKTAVKKPATKPAVKIAPKPAAKTEVKTVAKPKVEAEVPRGPKKASEMSTEELQNVLRRINLEKQYNDLVFKPMTDAQRTNKEKAKAFAGKVLKKAGEKAVQKVADKAADRLIESIIGKAARKVVAKTP